MDRGPISKIARFWHTVRYLRPVQIYGRIGFALTLPQADSRPAPRKRALPRENAWVLPARRRSCMLQATQFCFLHESHDLERHGWDDPHLEKLWRYNLHYFDDLNAEDAISRKGWHDALLARWVDENPPPSKTSCTAPSSDTAKKAPTRSDTSRRTPTVGWEPYPTSLRIVNWIQWELAGNTLTQKCVDHLAMQVRWLRQRLEVHLLGNHLFANAKALVFAGLFFEGDEARRWLAKGLHILRKEIPEQILSDGGHFERSTMYHALALEDMLGLHNLFQTFATELPPAGQEIAQAVHTRIAPMRHFLETMLHPDGEISFFNDAAIGIAPRPSELLRYADELGFPSTAQSALSITRLSASGYLRIQSTNSLHEKVSLQTSPVLVALLDVAPVGPDYIPGHAHADTLSFELSLFGKRVFVNSGTSCYGINAERDRQRGTAAHNTVVLNGENSSEVWAGFRVARRAFPRDLEISDGETIQIRCAHDGYRRLPGHPEHTRKWFFAPHALTLEDCVHGPCRNAVAYFHLHPNVSIEPSSDGTTGKIRLSPEHALEWQVESGTLTIAPSTYHPEFGRSVASHCLVLQLHDGNSRIRFAWS